MTYLRTPEQRANIDKLIADIESGAITLIKGRYFGARENPLGLGSTPDLNQCCAVGLICKHLDYIEIPWRYNTDEVSEVFEEGEPIMDRIEEMYGFDILALQALQSINDNYRYTDDQRKAEVISCLKALRDAEVEAHEVHS